LSTLFLFSSAFFARTTLLVCWLFGALPVNHTPFAVDVLAAVFAPRLLIAWWAYEAHMHPLVVVVFAALELFEKFSPRVRVKVGPSNRTRARD